MSISALTHNITSKAHQFVWFVRDLAKSHDVMFLLIKRDFTDRYVGSFVGILWAVIQPLMIIVVFWVVFEMGFRAIPVGEGEESKTPFTLWLVSGIIPWFFFAEAWGSASSAVLEKSYLVKKVKFRSAFLPIIKIVSALFVHFFFIVITLIIFAFNRYNPGWGLLQLFYYLPALILFLLALSWWTSALAVFLRDIPHLVSVILQVGMWATPIIWPPELLTNKPTLDAMMKLNPMYYIVRGYRDSFLQGPPFWTQGYTTYYFWGVTIFLFVTGALLFRRLRPHFADVL